MDPTDDSAKRPIPAATSRARRAVTIYAVLIGLVWLVAWMLRVDNESLASAILIVALIPSVLLALPLVESVTIDNSVVASAVLLTCGCINALLLYGLIRYLGRRAE